MPLLLPPLSCHPYLFLLSNTCNTRTSIPAGNFRSVSKAPLEGAAGGLQQKATVESKMLTAVSAALCQQKTWNTTWSLRKSRTQMWGATSRSSQVHTTSQTQSWRSGTPRTWSLCMRQCRIFTVQRRTQPSKLRGCHICAAAAAAATF